MCCYNAKKKSYVVPRSLSLQLPIQGLNITFSRQMSCFHKQSTYGRLTT